MLFSLVLLMLVGCGGPKQAPAVTMPSRDVVVDETAAQELVTRLQQAVDSDTSSASLHIREQELTSLAALYLQGSPVSDLTVWFEPQEVFVRASLDWQGIHDLRARGFVAVSDDNLALHLDALSVDDRAIPRWVRASIAHAASDALSDASLPLAVDEIALHQGVMVISVRH